MGLGKAMHYKKLSDKNLLISCFRGEKAAWDAFVNRFSKLIYHSIYKAFRGMNLPCDFQVTDDIYQEVFLSLFKDDYRKLKQFKGKNNCSLTSWLRMIATRTVIDFARKQRSPVSLDDAPLNGKPLVETLPDKRELPDESLEKQEWYQLLMNLVQELPPKDRHLFELSYYQELPDSETAQIMNLSIGAVYMRKSRIKQKLIKVIQKKKYC